MLITHRPGAVVGTRNSGADEVARSGVQTRPRQWWVGRTGTFSREVAWMVLRAVVPTGECR